MGQDGFDREFGLEIARNLEATNEQSRGCNARFPIPAIFSIYPSKTVLHLKPHLMGRGRRDITGPIMLPDYAKGCDYVRLRKGVPLC